MHYPFLPSVRGAVYRVARFVVSPVAVAACPLGALVLGVAPGAAWAGGAVKVTSDMVGMRIYVDGADTGLATPATVGNLAPGRHEVRVRGDCRVGASLVTIEEGATATVSLASAEGRGQLTVQPSPADAVVMIDGAAVSGAKVVSCGEHTVAVSAPGYLQALLKVAIEADERRSLPVELEVLGTATFVINVAPATAKVVVDGRLLGTGSFTDDTIPAGPHIIEVSADGYEPVSEQLLVDAGETRAFTYELRAVGGGVAAAGGARASDMSGSSSSGASNRGSGGTMSPLRATGIGVAVAGVGLGVYGLTRFGQAASAYQEYLDRSQYGPGPESEVAAIRDEEVVPLRNIGVVTTTLGTALLAGGVTLVVAF